MGCHFNTESFSLLIYLFKIIYFIYTNYKTYLQLLNSKLIIVNNDINMYK